MIRTELKTHFCSSVLVLLAAFSVRPSGAQITNQIRVTMTHPFVAGETAFPPGQYDLRMDSNSDNSIMTITSADGNRSDQFLVRQSDANHVPRHTELVFNRYGNQEFLTKIYEKGSRSGVAVQEPSKQEVRLQKEGQHAIEHTETSE